MRPDLGQLRWGYAACAGLLVVGAGVSALLRGPIGAAGFAFGLAVVVVGFTVSTLVILVANAIRPALVLPFGMLTYVAKVVVIGLLLAGLSARQWPGLVPAGIGMIAAGAVWCAAQVVWVVRTQHPYGSIATG